MSSYHRLFRSPLPSLFQMDAMGWLNDEAGIILLTYSLVPGLSLPRSKVIFVNLMQMCIKHKLLSKKYRHRKGLGERLSTAD